MGDRQCGIQFGCPNRINFYTAPNFENPADDNTDNVYEVQVTVTDSEGLSDTQDYPNGNRRKRSPNGFSLDNSTLAENTAIGQVIGQFSSTDEDANDTFTYSLVTGTGDTDNGLFSIVSDELQNAAILDFETQETYSIRVRTTDNGGEFFEETFTITVTDEDEESL